MGDVSEEALLDYFHSAGGDSGRVKNADLLKTFKPFIGHSDLQLRGESVLICVVLFVCPSQGEKYLILKKKYRHLLHERDARPQGGGGPQPRQPSPARTAAKQSVKKEWIYSAAGARVPDLSQLLRQDPSLANKKTALHWAAKHGNQDMAALVVNAGADVNTKSVSGYTPLHIAALHGHQHMLDLLVQTYGAKENVRDYSGHLACYYLNPHPKEAEGPADEVFPLVSIFFPPFPERNRNRKLASLFHSKKKWGSAEELAPIEEERTASHQLALPPFRPRKFSR
uniref:SOWAHA-C winged helix-turn-helix domain-containing protein n=1 Tax=Salarias fasciatus TaxID=181472 RepID=A0A672HV47_SALFA